LIGDVMRSDEIVCDASHDARLLKRWRERMDSEPVLLGLPSAQSRPEPVRSRRARAWMAPAAIAAGFAVVAGALVVTRLAAPDGAAGDRGSVLAGTVAPPAADVLPVAAQGAQVPSSQSAADVPQMIRSAELDRYLAAHRQYANGAVQVAPGGGVRNAAAVAPGR
jgi:sigma-E factor negative regulatory protein RseA